MKISQLSIGDQGQISHIEPNELSSKFIEMGLYIGQHIEVLFVAPFGDPIAFKVGNYVLSLRKSEADLIHINS